MNKRSVLMYALINSIGTALYVILVVLFMNLMGESQLGVNETLIIPIAMLMLLVSSVALVGSLIFGRPVVWLLNGKKNEAVLLLISTIGIFMLLTLIVFFILVALG